MAEARLCGQGESFFLLYEIEKFIFLTRNIIQKEQSLRLDFCGISATKTQEKRGASFDAPLAIMGKDFPP